MKFLLLFLIQSLLLCFVSSNSDYDVYVKAQNLLKKKLSLIYNRFELNTPEGTALFTVPQNLPTTLWDINKNKFALNILEKSEYKTLFSGSSVTAGHDNYYNQSYPFVYERALKPVFDILDVDFIVHNIAQGTNPCSPYVYCYETMGGFIPDTFIWEQSFNCGHDPNVFERAGRWLATTKYPNIVYFSSSGSAKPANTCPKYEMNTFNTDKNKKIPRTSDDWTPAVAGIPEWDVTHSKVLEYRNFFEVNYKSYNSDKRFTPWGPYKAAQSVKTFGFDMWITGNKVSKVSPPSNLIKECKPSFFSSEALVFGSASGHGANWHPSRPIHMYRGEILAFAYGLILFDALEMVMADSKTMSKANAIKKYSDFLLSYKTDPLPKPLRSVNAYNTTCYTDFTPNFSPHLSLKSRVLGKTNWQYVVPPPTKAFVVYQYADSKPYYINPAKDNSPIYLFVPIKEVSIFSVCSLDKISPSLIFNVYTMDSFPSDPASFVLSKKNTKVEVASEVKDNLCLDVSIPYQGNFVVELIDPQAKTKLSHFISYAKEKQA